MNCCVTMATGRRHGGRRVQSDSPSAMRPLSGVSKPAIARMSEMLLSTPIEGFIGCCEAVRDMDHRELLANIKAPTLIVWGDRSRSFSRCVRNSPTRSCLFASLPPCLLTMTPSTL